MSDENHYPNKDVYNCLDEDFEKRYLECVKVFQEQGLDPPTRQEFFRWEVELDRLSAIFKD